MDRLYFTTKHYLEITENHPHLLLGLSLRDQLVHEIHQKIKTTKHITIK
jgi:hypothetical protein